MVGMGIFLLLLSPSIWQYLENVSVAWVPWTIKIYRISLVNRLLSKDECQLAFVLSHIYESMLSQGVESMTLFEASLNSDVFPTESEILWGPDTRELLHMYNHSFHTSSGVSNKFNYKRNKRKRFFICTARKNTALLGKLLIHCNEWCRSLEYQVKI